MLVMYTLNNSVSSKLPQTVTIKFVDIWICYGLFLHFLIIILLILIEHLPEEEADSGIGASINIKTQSKRLKKSPKVFVAMFAKRILTVLEIVFILTYSVVALYLYNFNMI